MALPNVVVLLSAVAMSGFGATVGTAVSADTGTMESPGLVTCFVGYCAGNRHHFLAGTSMECAGSCANVTINVNYTPISIFLCDPLQVCEEMGFADRCGHVNDDMTMCCCENERFCNVRTELKPDFFNQTFQPSLPPTNVSCYVGVDLHPTAFGNPMYHKTTTAAALTTTAGESMSGMFMDCAGECANVSLDHIGTLYFCDPIAVCTVFEMSNRCNTIERLLLGCCCSESQCNYSRIRPTSTPPLSSTPSSHASTHAPVVWPSLVALVLHSARSLHSDFVK